MVDDISPRNGKSQSQIFLGEISPDAGTSVHSGMGKTSADDPPPIYLGDWLELLETNVGEAAVLAGCDQSYISNIVANRKTNINVLYLLRLSEKLGVTVNDFYRPLPSKSHLNAFKNLSPKAQATILARQRRKA